MALADISAKPPVCVTGANGFVGSWVVKTLLENGYTNIHLSIEPGSDPAHLLSLPGADGHGVRLTVHEANVMDADAIERAVAGCARGGVFHLASPNTISDVVDPQKELLDPSEKGTLHVLAAAKKFRVRRVVLTSSIVAMMPNPGWPRGRVVDESCWTDVDYCISRKKWYPVSKTLAERAAWNFAEKNDLDVVAINPSTCLGELLHPGPISSCAVLQQLLEGSKETYECLWFGAVHVKDVAKAQLLLFESPNASGRYLCTNGIHQFCDFAQKVSNLFPGYPVHSFSGETQPGLVSCEDASRRLTALGFNFTPLDVAVRDTVLCLEARGILKHQ